MGPAQAGPLAGSEDAVTIAYQRRKLYTKLASDPVAKTLEIKLLGQLGGPVSPLPRLRTVIEVATSLRTLVCEANMAAGMFEPNTLFDLGFNSIKSML
uniref:Carrier domain-containing protein n=1 Tax=Peronospora matthiolae TaxID=2874970 RepID=A0AAV1UL84_9STRA